MTTIDCKANLKSEKVECGGAAAGDGRSDAIIYAGQNVYVKLTSSNVGYDGGAQEFTFDVTVRNLIPQPIGTVDGTTLDPYGVKVFFINEPVATTGTGTITVIADGSATFLTTAKPYYQYDVVLDQYEVSAAKQWTFGIPSTVETFEFSVAISSAVEFPDGWIDIQPASWFMPALATRDLSAKVFNALGVDITSAGTPVDWSTGDANVATVTPVGYQAAGDAWIATLTGVQAGTTSITADRTGPIASVGAMTSNIGGIRRIWKGTASTDYNTPGNWRHGRVPNALDSAVMNGDSATQFPVMAQNNTVGGVIMEPGALTPSVDIGSFDYTLTSSIDHGPTGLILGTGRMLFTGTAKTIDGGLTNVDYRNARFTGTYSLSTNLNVTGGRIVVQGGRLRSTGFRIRVRPS
jgi:hypothetical protein